MPRSSGNATGRRVLFVLPHEHFGRMLIDAGSAAHLAGAGVAAHFVTRDAEDAARLAEIDAGRLSWSPLLRPLRPLRALDGSRSTMLGLMADVRLACGFYHHLSLVYRFNHLRGMVGFRNRLRLSRPRKAVARREGHPVDRWLGWPFPSSEVVFRLSRRLYESRWQRHADVEAVFDAQRPDLLFLASVQSPFVTPYALAARARDIPIVGMIGSWDQPSTKGPIAPGVTHFLAHSRYVRDEIQRLHGVPATVVTVTGWPQMDVYRDLRWRRSREETLRENGVEPGHAVVLFGAYTERLGSHEPAILDRLAAMVRAGTFRRPTTLLIRPHPADTDWARRLGHLHEPPFVVVAPPRPRDLAGFANLLAHADVVLASAGTICLDAVAQGTPAVGVAFDLDPLVPHHDRPERMFEMEHYASVVSTGGLPIARNIEELAQAIVTRLEEPDADADGMARLRDLHLEPLDGRAGERIAGEALRVLRDHASSASAA